VENVENVKDWLHLEKKLQLKKESNLLMKYIGANQSMALGILMHNY